MQAETKDVLDYIVACVSEFAAHHDLHQRDAYRYLRQYNGIQFLQDYYDVEHTLSFDDAVDDLTTICIRNGGTLV